MGQESSVLCSASAPNGYNKDKLPMSANAIPSCDAVGRASSRQPMQFVDEDVLESERINRWTKDLGVTGQRFGPDVISALSCGSAQAAPQEYLADTQDGHAIVMDSREGPTFMEFEEDQIEVGLDPDESSSEALRRAKIGKLTKLSEID
eukprot:CAMPEP_0197630198 /NCGR_PEP_ID=MMETSP1338-20131121/7765_1 /TAXON_ID=43686 ORGANISM="Pelagodinium beii, Strain RCC1491" /NCGR_SAMPLE_ID=MMETSP1338 /ASSEMBLY_ACC=CAM_ASM_000754 /LENGTH=148 /DNA_ID=CAMNT_0043201369 /DNA_START=30 /DNA_END=473 /DNA_ORIENTATION=+